MKLPTRFGHLGGEDTTMSVEEFFTKAKKDPTMYATPHERLLKAIGDPVLVDTSKDARLGRLHSNAVIRTYKSFEGFYGMEETVESIVGFIKQAAQGLEESRQVLYLLGPVGGGKSSLAERIKRLFEKEPFYAIQGSPVFDSPLSLFTKEDAELLGIPERYLNVIPSPWLVKRLTESRGDLSGLKVVKLQPSALTQTAMTRTEPGDENNQDISSLVGKVDISKLHKFTQEDADAYSYSGALNRANQGIMEFVEMFKAPIKSLNPLLVATQEHVYNGTEAIGAMPFHGILLSHSNNSEWQSFKTNARNEAFLDRIYLIKVPYCLQVSQEVKIYEKLLKSSTLSTAPIAPKTLDLLAKFSVISRLREEGTTGVAGMKVKLKAYDGENVRETSVGTAKPYLEYRQVAGVDEGMDGVSTRFAYKILSRAFNTDSEEIAVDPILLMNVLNDQLIKENLPKELETTWFSYLAEFEKEYRLFLDASIRGAYLESFDDYCQAIFDRYIDFVGALHDDSSFRDPETGQVLDHEYMDKYLKNIEDSIGIANRKDFRTETQIHCLRYRSEHGKNPSWQVDKKLKRAIEAKVHSSLKDITPVISMDTGKKSTEDEKKHNEFVGRMMALGYTKRQTSRVVSWSLRTQNK